MKKVLSFILCIVFITTLLPIAAITAEAGTGSYTWYIDNYNTLVINGSGEMSYEEFPWADRKDEIKHVSIGYGVPGIQAGAFKDYTGIESVSFPDSAFEIGDEAFSGCTSLVSITMPKGNVWIGNKAFYGCTGLKSVEMPLTYQTTGGVIVGNPYRGVKEIGDYAFAGCNSLESVSMPHTVIKIGAGAFKDCTALAKITTGGQYSEIPFIGASAFENTAFYNDENNWNDGALYINFYLIKAKDTAEKVYVKKGTYSIAEDAFAGCDKLKEVAIPNDVKRILAKMFEGCVALEKATITHYINSIETGTFADSENLVIICCEGSAANIYATENDIECETYKETGMCGEKIVWTLDENGLLELTGTGEMARYSGYYSDPPLWENHNRKIKEIKIGHGITNISIGAFRDTSVERVEIPDTVKSIGDSAFSGCTKLESIEIPDSVTTIGEHAFCECGNLKSATISNNATTIGRYAFVECTRLESIEIPDSVTSIGEYAFLGCLSLGELAISKNLETIGDGAFAYSNATFSVDEENPNYSSADGALYNKEKTTLLAKGSVNDTYYKILDSVDTIGAGVFYGNNELKQVDFPYNENGCNLKIIGDRAFYKCGALEKIEIPEGVTIIGESAFEICGKLSKVTIPEGVTSIGKYAFFRCASLRTARTPKSITSIGEHAFGGTQGLSFELWCYSGVVAEFANKNNLNYYIIGSSGNDNTGNNTGNVTGNTTSKPTVGGGGGGGDTKPKQTVGLTNFKPANTYDNTFVDVANDAWYQDSVKVAYELDLVKGAAEGKFNPDGNMTIAEAVTLAARIHSIYNTGKAEFTQGAVWYQVYVDYAIEKGIITKDQFTDYNAPATRAEFAEIFAKAIPEADYEAINNIEAGKIPDVAESDAVYLLYNAGIVAGSDEAHSFKPETNIKRCEVATIITRIVNKENRVNFEIQ